MINLNGHILNEIGCEPENLLEAREMCRAAMADGVQTIVATARWDKQSFEPPLSVAACESKLELLRREMQGALAFKLGFTMIFRPDLATLLERYGSSLTLGGGRHLLVSLPALHVPAEAEEVWAAIARGGFSVIVTRPECNLALRQDGARLDNWVARGVTLQIDAASIIGVYGRAVRRFAMQLVQQYQSSTVVVSHARRMRPYSASLKLAQEELVRKIGARQAHLLVSERPASIVGAAMHTTGNGQARTLRLPLISPLSGLRSPKNLPNVS